MTFLNGCCLLICHLIELENDKLQQSSIFTRHYDTDERCTNDAVWKQKYLSRFLFFKLLVDIFKVNAKDMSFLKPTKFCIRRNNNKVDSIKTGRVVITHLLLWCDLEKCMYTTIFKLMLIKFYCHYLIYKYNFTFLLFHMTYKKIKKQTIKNHLNFKGLFRPFLTFSFQHFSSSKFENW